MKSLDLKKIQPLSAPQMKKLKGGTENSTSNYQATQKEKAGIQTAQDIY